MDDLMIQLLFARLPMLRDMFRVPEAPDDMHHFMAYVDFPEDSSDLTNLTLELIKEICRKNELDLLAISFSGDSRYPQGTSRVDIVVKVITAEAAPASDAQLPPLGP